ncbi:MAG: cation transporter [Bacteroidetes bacterium]|nr:cation transporter [Bacteroidota bacterium]MBS1630375.1 cation transporter [Bacteroidota bacterium]
MHNHSHEPASGHTHTHSHGHHGHSHLPSTPDRVGAIFVWSIALNSVYIIAELAAGLMYHSVALLSDASHNVSDVASLLLSLLAFRLARRKSNSRFTYGYKKTTVLSALGNAVILLIAIGVLGYESFTRLLHPQPVEGGVIAWVAGIGIAVNAASALLFFRSRKNDLNVRSAYLHMASDALVSVGVVLAGILISFTGWYWLDPVIGLAVLAVILFSTWSLLVESFRLSVDAVPESIRLEEIQHVMESVPGVRRVHHIHIWAMSTTENALTAHVMLDSDLVFEEKIKTIRRLKHELEHQNIPHSTIEMEQG